MKVKIFWHADTDELENEINQFISDKKVVDIKYSISITTPTEGEMETEEEADTTESEYSALIMYE